MEDIRGVRLRKFKLRKIILGVRMHFRHNFSAVGGLIWIKLRRLVQNNMQTAVI